MTEPSYHRTSTSLLNVEYLEWNPEGQHTAVLVHGWPDSVRTWFKVAPILAVAGFRVLAPSVRGYAGTQFISADTPRSGQLSALGRDLIEFVQAMELDQPLLVGHDWGARAVANAAGLHPGIGSHLVMISVGYGTNTLGQPLSLQQAKNYWYHWYMDTPIGRKSLAEDRNAFARIMWDTWAPPGWFDEQEFAATAEAFNHPDWVDVVTHSYRHRWGLVAGDPAYDADEKVLSVLPVLATPTLVLHGDADGVNPIYSSEGKERWFTGPYQRTVMQGIGHFPQRESSQRVADEILKFCGVKN
jgi:pimeloyl-ACP methyl ester carboxylesterase